MAGRQNKAGDVQKNTKAPPKYRQLSLTEKCQILARLEAGETNGMIAKNYGIVHSAVSYIKKNKQKIYDQRDLLEQQQGSAKRTRLTTSTDTSALEQGVYRWFCQKRSLGEPISGPMLQEKALLYNEKLGGSSSFQASQGWIHRFKARHGIRELSMKGEKLSGDTAASSEFVAEFKKIVGENEYDLDNIYNADETGLAWKSLPRKTLATGNEKEVAGRKVLKDRVTVMACANASGTHRIPLLVIGKSKKPRCFKNVHTIPVNYQGQHSAWINREIFTDWYKTTFLPAIKQRKSGENEKFLLLLDNAPAHPSADDLNSIDECCTVIFLPPNVTALIQPMDQGVIEATKKHYKKAILRKLLLEEESSEDDTVTNFLKKWNMLDCCISIAQAWESLSHATLRNAWNKLLSLTDANTAVTHVESECGLRHLVNRIPGYTNFTETETRSWLEEDTSLPVWHILSDEELLNLSQPTDDPMDGSEFNDSQEDENSDDISQELPTPREALAGLNCVLQWYRSRWESEETVLSSLHKISQLVEDIILEK